MITRFHTKPIEIAAYQWNPDKNQEQMPPAPSDLLRSKIKWRKHIGWELKTLKSWHTLVPGDWLICNIAGEWYSCKPDIFEAIYEPIYDEQPQQIVAADVTRQGLEDLIDRACRNDVIKSGMPTTLSGLTDWLRNLYPELYVSFVHDAQAADG